MPTAATSEGSKNRLNSGRWLPRPLPSHRPRHRPRHLHPSRHRRRHRVLLRPRLLLRPPRPLNPLNRSRRGAFTSISPRRAYHNIGRTATFSFLAFLSTDSCGSCSMILCMFHVQGQTDGAVPDQCLRMACGMSQQDFPLCCSVTLSCAMVWVGRVWITGWRTSSRCSPRASDCR